MRNKRSVEYDIAYMKMADTFAQLSYAKRNKVGCIILTDDGQIISQGFNGTPKGMDNCCEFEEHIDEYDDIHCCRKDSIILKTKPEVLHAESNAIVKCAKSGYGSTNRCTLYVTLSPCFDCAKLIIQSGITRVVFRDKYRFTDGIDFLADYGIKVDQIDIERKKIIPYKRK